MATVKQVGLLPAGCQPWNNEVCAASGDRFAYCATLAIYIYELDRKYNEFCLHSIMSEHKKTITAISWSPWNSDMFASSSADNQIVVWNVAQQQVVAKLNNIRGTPISVDWCKHERDCLSFVYGRGPLFLWNFTANTQLNTHKEAHNFMSDICQFKWHPKKVGKMVFGHIDGSISLFSPGVKCQKHILRPSSLEGTDEEDPISDLQWDPLSVEYLLVANSHFGIRLIDSESLSVIMTFHLPSAASQVHTLAWISSAPGIFLTGDAHVGIMRIWNVSKSSPLENIKLKKTGFHALHVFSTAPGGKNSTENNVQSESHISSTSPTLAPSITTSSRYALPPAHAVCAFLDGGIGLYDLGSRKWNFLRDQGHVETIFDCKFKPDNPDLLATASFDGTIKIWDINTMTCTESSPGNEGVIYSLSWAPADLNCIVASTSRHGVFIWDMSKGKVIKRFNEHGKSSVYSVSWNQKDSRRIASCAADGYCIVRQVDGQLVIKYKHPASVFGCDWSPHNKDMIATGCEDKNVRVFYLATTSEQPLKVFTGHTAKVFHVRWSPLREGILCSGSDDGTIRIWDYTHDTCVSTLSGHGAPVRGLLWSTELPYLLISGSWDYSIRIWDTRDGACIDTVLDHGADVYGLTAHPQRPFIVASCSRDSTVRVWSLAPLIQPLEINIIASQPWSEVISTTEHSMSQGTPPLLTGRASRDFRHLLEKAPGDTQQLTLQWFSKFFMHPGGTDNLWELVSVINDKDVSMLSSNYGKGIIHVKHITQFKSSAAQELELIKMSKFGGGVGAPSKEERLRQAASLHICLGNLQRYCELMVELGEWEKALCVAPGVSLKYWSSLAERRANCLIADDSDDTVPMCVAIGKADKLVDFFTSRGRLLDALVAAAAANEGTISPPNLNSPTSSGVNGFEGNASESYSLIEKTSSQLAEWYFRNGMPVLAACCHLAVSDCQQAIAKLIRGNELELAVCVGRSCPNVEGLTGQATEHLARRCERIGRWDLAVELLKDTKLSDVAMAKVCARCAASMDEINQLHARAGFPSMDECVERAESVKSQNYLEALKFYMMSISPEKGLEFGLQIIKDRISRPDWKVDDVFEFLQLMGSIRTEKLQQNKCSGLRGELLILCAYAGALVAIRRRYDSIVYPLFRHMLYLMKRESNSSCLSESLVTSEMEAWNAHQTIYSSNSTSSPKREKPQATVEQRSIYANLLKKAGEEHSPIGVGFVCVSSSNLPSHSDVHNSCLTGQRIRGPAFFLEDGRSAIAISDAVMWACVNPFSPLGSGVRLNPF